MQRRPVASKAVPTIEEGRRIACGSCITHGKQRAVLLRLGGRGPGPHYPREALQGPAGRLPGLQHVRMRFSSAAEDCQWRATRGDEARAMLV